MRGTGKGKAATADVSRELRGACTAPASTAAWSARVVLRT
jgi:hypothetical protein